MSINTNMIRISGLSSGLDTEALVEGMMTTEQTRINKQEQLITRLEWKTEAYRDINTKIKNFREQYLSVLNAGSNMLSSSSYNINQVTMLDTTSAVTVSAGASAESGQMTIDSITQLAEAAELKGSEAFNGEAMYTDTTLADLDLTTGLVFDGGEISFSINGETFTFDETTTIGSMMTAINTNSAAGVKMTYSSLTKGFKIKSTSTGADSQVNLVNIKGNAFSAVGSAFGIAEGMDSGQDAVLSIENVEVVRPQNTFTIDGITYSLKGESNSAVSFNVDRNIDGTVNKITEFIASYNTLIGELQDKLDEEQHRAYDPLTDDERSELSETEVNKWEDMAKSGQLRNDSYISTLLTTMRSAFYTTVSGVDDNAASIGLKTGAYSDNGQITIDADALKQALQNEPDKVLGLFTATSTSTDPAEKFKASGLITRISSAMLDYVDSTVDGAISGLETRITEAENRLDVLEDRFSTKEEMLWQRFTAMETALAKLNSQSSWLSSLFSSVE